MVQPETLEAILPQFYLLSFLERKYNPKRQAAEKVVPGPTLRTNNAPNDRHGSSVGMGSTAVGSTSIAMSSRAAKEKHDNIVRLRRVAPKMPKQTVSDKVLKDLHMARRKIYSRGHCIPSPNRGPSPLHPRGAAPVVLRDYEMGSSGRNATTSRPQTASDQFSPIKSSRKARDAGPLYTRPTQRLVLNSRGSAIAEDCARSSWTFRRPLDTISMPRPSSFASSLLNAPLPDCAECLLVDNPYATLACAARCRILEKTTNADRLYLVGVCSGKKPYPSAHPSEAPYSIDYSPPGSPDRRLRPCWKKSPFE